MTHINEWMESMFPEVADCYISISKTITQKEWRKIYREVLPLSKKLDFCYVKKFDFEGVKGQCLVRPTEIAENFYGLITHKLKLEGLYSQRLAIGPIYIDTKLVKKNFCYLPQMYDVLIILPQKDYSFHPKFLGCLDETSS